MVRLPGQTFLGRSGLVIYNEGTKKKKLAGIGWYRGFDWQNDFLVQNKNLAEAD
jgi:hypothetical protein